MVTGWSKGEVEVPRQRWRRARDGREVGVDVEERGGDGSRVEKRTR